MIHGDSPVIWVGNQVDRCHDVSICVANLEAAMAFTMGRGERFMVTSALTGEGVEQLFTAIQDELQILLRKRHN